MRSGFVLLGSIAALFLQPHYFSLLQCIVLVALVEFGQTAIGDSSFIANSSVSVTPAGHHIIVVIEDSNVTQVTQRHLLHLETVEMATLVVFIQAIELNDFNQFMICFYLVSHKLTDEQAIALNGIVKMFTDKTPEKGYVYDD